MRSVTWALLTIATAFACWILDVIALSRLSDSLNDWWLTTEVHL